MTLSPIDVSFVEPNARPRVLRAPAAGLAAVLLAISVAVGHAQVSPAENDAILQFQRAADGYAFLHRQLERRLGPIEVTARPETIRRAIDAMAAAVRVARPDAQQGDIFNPGVQKVLRARIAKALRAHAFTPADVRAAELAEGIDARSVALKVNGSFPWVLSTPMFPCIMETLPAIPPELQYRIVGGDLLLIDVHASLIVDILPFALADNGGTS